MSSRSKAKKVQPLSTGEEVKDAASNYTTQLT